MITPSFSITATERVLPRMALDFTTASLDSRVTFTRSGNTATVTNSSGLIAPINANLPRFDFDPIALTCKGLLIEEARTNLWTYSDDFSNVIWNKTRGSITSNSVTSPDGTQNADTFVEDAATGNHYVLQAATIVAGNTCSSSIYLKAAGRRYIQLLMDANNLVDFVYAYFDLQTGTITQAAQVQGTATLPSATITNMGNGWYRCTVTAKLGAVSLTGRLFTLPTNVPTGAALAGIAGLNAASFYVYGGQFEVGAFPTSYIPTVASQVTRTADVAVMTGTNFSSWYNSSATSYVAEFTTPSGFDPGVAYNLVTFWDGASVNNQINTRYGPILGPAPASIDTWVKVGGVDVVDSSGATLQPSTTYKHAVGLKASTGANCTSAGTVYAASPSSMPTGITALTFSAAAAVASVQPNHYLRKFSYFPQRLIDAELTAFSK